MPLDGSQHATTPLLWCGRQRARHAVPARCKVRMPRVPWWRCGRPHIQIMCATVSVSSFSRPIPSACCIPPGSVYA